MQDGGEPGLLELLAPEQIRPLLESFCRLTGVAAAIIDLQGEILVAANWQQLCTDFHRREPGCAARCTESDTTLALRLQTGKGYAIYRCQNGLVDCAAPIVIGGRHLANAFIGQFLTAPADLDLFLAQARQFGFAPEPYLAALAQVPVVAEEKIPLMLDFLTEFARIAGTSSLERSRAFGSAREAEKARTQLNEAHSLLEQRVEQRTSQLQAEILGRKKIEAALAALATQYAVLAGVEFFTAVSRHLAEELALDYVFIGRLQGSPPDQVRVLAGWAGGEAMGPMEYFLANTPCEQVLGKELCVYPAGIQGLFPQDELLVTMAVESYCGVVLCGRDGRPQGLLVGLSRAPIADQRGTSNLLSLFETAVSAELSRNLAEEEREKMLAELEQANREMTRLTEVMAHHLQEPARRIVTFSQRLRQTAAGNKVDLDENCRVCLSFIESEAVRLKTLVNDIQQYLLVATPVGKVEPTAAGPLVADLVQTLTPRLAALAGRIEVEPLPTVLLDGQRLRELFAVLLDNALKHAPADRPLLVRVSSRAELGRACFRVEDNGGGIDPALRVRAFQLFEKFQTTERGTGLGLAIARRIVEKQGGEIYLEESELGGLAVIFDLPLAAADGRFSPGEEKEK